MTFGIPKDKKHHLAPAGDKLMGAPPEQWFPLAPAPSRLAVTSGIERTIFHPILALTPRHACRMPLNCGHFTFTETFSLKCPKRQDSEGAKFCIWCSPSSLKRPALSAAMWVQQAVGIALSAATLWQSKAPPSTNPPPYFPPPNPYPWPEAAAT